MDARMLDYFREILLKKFTGFSIFLFFLISLFYFATSAYLFKQHGPSWIFIPSDLDYTNLLNALNILAGKSSTLFVHPDITTVYSYAIFIYFTHLIIGGHYIVQDVIQKPETYMTVIFYIYWFITAYALFYLATIIYQHTSNLWLALFSQLFFLIFVRDYNILYLVNNASADNIQLICSVIMISIAFKLPTVNLLQPHKKYIVMLSFLACLAFAAKFTGIIFLLFPLLIIPKMQLRFFYLLVSAILLIVLFMPLFQHIDLFAVQVFSTASNIFTEHLSRNEHSYFQTISDGLVYIYSIGYYIPLLLFDIAIVVFFAFSKKFKNTLLSVGEFHFILACTIVAILSICMMINRLQPHYLIPYLIFFIMPVLYSAHIIWRNLKKSYYRKYMSGLVFLILIFLFFPIYSKIESASVFYNKNKSDVMNILNLVNNDYSRYAIITAVHASNLLIGFRHPFCGFPKQIGQALPANNFLCPFPHDNTCYDHHSHETTLLEIYRKYPGIIFHTENNNFQNYFDRDFQFKTIYHGRFESLKTIDEIPGAYYQPSANRIEISSDNIFVAQKSGCVLLKFSNDYPYVLGGYIMYFNNFPTSTISVVTNSASQQNGIIKTEKTGEILRRNFNLPVLVTHYQLSTVNNKDAAVEKSYLTWELDASNDDAHWYVLDKKSYLLEKNLNKTSGFSVRHPAKYRFYKLKISNYYKPRMIDISKWTIYVVRNYNWHLVYSDNSISLMPKNWLVEASNNGQNWNLLDRRNHLKSWNTSERSRYIILNRKHYKYIRFCSLNPARRWIASIRPLYKIVRAI